MTTVVSQSKRGRPKKYSTAERAEKWNDYIKNVYNPKHQERCREQRRSYYQRNKAILNANRAQYKRDQKNFLIQEREQKSHRHA